MRLPITSRHLAGICATVLLAASVTAQTGERPQTTGYIPPARTAAPPLQPHRDWKPGEREMAQAAAIVDPWQRRVAYEAALAAGAAKDAVLILPYLGEPIPELRAMLLEALTRLPGEAVCGAVIGALLGGGEETLLLHDILPDLASHIEQPLLEIVNDTFESTGARMAAAYALGRISSRAAIDPLLKLTASKEPGLAQEAVRALYTLNLPELAPQWRALLDHDDQAIRAAAIAALSRCANDAALNTLYEVASGALPQEYALQVQAVDGMTAWPFPQCGPLLLDVMKKNLYTRQRIGSYLRAWTGLDLPDTPSLWEQALMPPAQQPTQAAPQLPPMQEAPTDLLREVQFVPPEFRGIPAETLNAQGALDGPAR
jgi:hypothetical protein